MSVFQTDRIGSNPISRKLILRIVVLRFDMLRDLLKLRLSKRMGEEEENNMVK